MAKINRDNSMDKEAATDGRITRREQRSINTKTKLLEVAIQLIKAKGYHNVTIDEICEKSGVTKGAFYHHFSSKESILGSTYLESDSHILKNKSKIMKKKTAIEQIAEVNLIYAEMVQYKGVEIMKQLIRNNLENRDSMKWLADFHNPKKRPAYQLQLDIIKAGQEKGEMRRDIDPENILFYLISWFNGFILDWCYNDGNYDFMEMIKEAISKLYVFLRVQHTE